MNLKKILNLNSYEWWRNHRRFVMLGIFIALFGSYLNPVIKVSKHKIICARWEANEIFIEQANKQLGLDSKSLMTAEYCENFK